MDTLDGIVCTERDAPIDDLLAAALHLWIGTLYGCKVKIF